MQIPRSLLARWANKSFDLKSLLVELGVRNPQVGSLIYCPFHPDREGGKRSAKIHPDAVHCFSESKQYRPYNILRFMGYTDVQIEEALRSKGNPPDELYMYEEARIDLRTPFLPLKSKFMEGKISFEEYVVQVVKGMEGILSAHTTAKAKEFEDGRRESTENRVCSLLPTSEAGPGLS